MLLLGAVLGSLLYVLLGLQLGATQLALEHGRDVLGVRQVLGGVGSRLSCRRGLLDGLVGAQLSVRLQLLCHQRPLLRLDLRLLGLGLGLLGPVSTPLGARDDGAQLLLAGDCLTLLQHRLAHASSMLADQGGVARTELTHLGEEQLVLLEQTTGSTIAAAT